MDIKRDESSNISEAIKRKSQVIHLASSTADPSLLTPTKEEGQTQSISNQNEIPISQQMNESSCIDDKEENIMNGYHIVEFPDGARYEGNFLNGKQHGFGKYTYPASVKIYEGQFEYDIQHGPGKVSWKSGAEFNGFFVNGLKKGHGKQLYATGEVSHGEYNNDVRNGLNTTVWVNGDEYYGMYVNDKRSGKGKFIDGDSGDIYEGDFKDNKKNGYGRLVNKYGELIYEGYFRDDFRDPWPFFLAPIINSLPTIPFFN